MASPSMKKGLNQPGRSFPMRFNRLPLATRRCAAWVVEVSLIAASALVPYSLGLYAKDSSGTALVPLNPVLATTQEAIAKTLALPLRDSKRQVAPLTNLFWCGALIFPVVVAGWQIYNLRKSGQTLPKRWFGVRVLTGSRTPPNFQAIFMREAVGRWGLPVGSAYLIWRYTGAFPDLSILVGLAGLMLLGESATFFFDPQRRTLHDRIAGTFVLKDAISEQPQASSRRSGQPITLEVQSTWTEPKQEEGRVSQKRQEKVTKIILTSLPSFPRWRLWDWMRQNPGITLLVVTIASMTSVLGTFVGTQIYIQSQANRREFSQQKNEVFLSLVKQLSDTSLNAPEERRGAIIALSTVDDPRAVPFLVDLLGQEKTEALLDTIQQAVVSTGPDALPPLQRLNQSLINDREALQRQGTPQERRLKDLQMKASQQAIAKILTIYTGQIHDADLSRTYLDSTTGVMPFTLVLDKTDLSGINFRTAILSHASLNGSRFYGAGDDGRFGTFDDWIADLSGADLKEADLTSALLSHVSMNRTSLVRAILNRANLSDASLSGANLGSAQLANANLRQAVLENAILTGANLANADLTQSNLQGARLGQAIAVGTQLQFARLTQSDWQEADLSTANLRQANLQYANLSSTKMVGTNLSKAQLQNANLQNADLSQADLRGANLAGADFKGAAFAAAKPTNSDQFIQSAPTAVSAALVKDVNFAQAQNLDPKQIALICSQGARHPQCR